MRSAGSPLLMTFARLFVVFVSIAGLAELAPCRARAQEEGACEAVLAGYGQVEELYRRGDYDGAASFLQAASVLCPNESLLLYNLARALERSAAQHAEGGDDVGAAERRHEALSTYDRFLAMGEGDAEVRERARARRDAIAAMLRPAPAGGDVAASLTQTAAPTCRGEASPLPWIVTGVGALLVGVGAGLGVAALDARSAADAAPSMEQAVARLSEARDLATGANALFIGGGIVGVAGLVWGGIDLAQALATRPCAAEGPSVRALGLEIRF